MSSSSTARILRQMETGITGPGGRGPVKTGNPRMDKLATGMWMGQQAKEWYEKGREKYRQQTTWSVTVMETEQIYRHVQRWLVDNLPQVEHKSVVATTQTVYFDAQGTETSKSRESTIFDEYEDPRGNSGHTETRVVVSMGDTRNQIVWIGGHKVTVMVAGTQPEDNDDAGSRRPRSRNARMAGNGRVIFQTRSVEAQRAVVDLLDGMVAGKNKRKPALWVADGWGNWRAQDAPVRKLSSVVVRDGLKEDLIDDLAKFLADEPKYNSLGIPWHRGYLLHGPPGTGKTSLIKAVAAELGLDLWYAPLGDLKEDSSLVDLIRSVKPRGILLLEDVDAYAAAKDRDDEDSDSDTKDGISSSALYNALDGVVTPHGLITIMTTNHIEKLDPALVRAGRADMTVELAYPSVSEISRLWTVFFPDDENWIVPRDEVPGISQAQVSEIFKSNWEDAAKARTALLDELGVISSVKLSAEQ